MYVEPEKYLRIFLHENAAMMMGIMDQSYYSICHLLVRLFILTVYILKPQKTLTINTALNEFMGVWS